MKFHIHNCSKSSSYGNSLNKIAPTCRLTPREEEDDPLPLGTAAAAAAAAPPPPFISADPGVRFLSFPRRYLTLLMSSSSKLTVTMGGTPSGSWRDQCSKSARQ